MTGHRPSRTLRRSVSIKSLRIAIIILTLILAATATKFAWDAMTPASLQPSLGPSATAVSPTAREEAKKKIIVPLTPLNHPPAIKSVKKGKEAM